MDVSKRWPVWPENVGRELEPETQAFKDILDGLAVLYESPFIRDIRNTILAYPESGLGNALNKKQMACKKWLVEELYTTCGPEPGRVHIQAGWYGVLAAMLLADTRFKIDRLTVLDVDASCEEVANSLNASHVEGGRFAFRCQDIYDLDYRKPPDGLEAPDLLINTSCEHLARFDRWLEQLPDGQLVALQSNNYWAIPEHVNSVDSLEKFAAQVQLGETLYSGELVLPKYTRFMLIGRK
jgi:hypothetical protein